MNRKPKIFPGSTIDDSPQQYLHRARMFRSAAINLPDVYNGEEYWLKYALLTHAIELSLKAFVRHLTKSAPPSKEPKQHDLDGWYQLAVQYGLSHDPTIEENNNILNELHSNHYTRYPQSRAIPVPSASIIADSTVDHLIDTFTKTINPQR